METAIAPLSFKVFEKALNSALDELQKSVKISKLTEPQSRSASNFLSGNDTFVSLPTGHGKSAWKPCESNLAGAVVSIFKFSPESEARRGSVTF